MTSSPGLRCRPGDAAAQRGSGTLPLPRMRRLRPTALRVAAALVFAFATGMALSGALRATTQQLLVASQAAERSLGSGGPRVARKERLGGTEARSREEGLWEEDWVEPQAWPWDAEAADDGAMWSTAAGLQILDDNAEPVHVMPEGNVIMGSVLMQRAQLWRYREWRRSCRTRYLCPAPEGFAACSWCSEKTGCLHGRLESNGGIVDKSIVEAKPFLRARQAAAMFAPISQRQSDIAQARFNKVDVYPLIFRCTLAKEVPMNVVGSFNLTWPLRNQATSLRVTNRLARRPPVASSSSAAVCGRALFGEVSAGNIVAQSEYARYHGFGTVYMYHGGSATVLHPSELGLYKHRLRLEDSKALRMIDMRNHLDRLYGGASAYAFLYSKSGGQMWLKFECQLRARRDGFGWVLHTDLDEFIFPGVQLANKQDPATPLLGFMLSKVASDDAMGLSIGGLNAECDDKDVYPGVPWPLDRSESEARWRAFMRRVSAFHEAVEYPDGSRYFARAAHREAPPCKNGEPVDPALKGHRRGNCDFHKVGAHLGSRKLFVRSSIEPQVLRVHEASQVVMPQIEELDVDEMFHRHYRCVNIESQPTRAIGFDE